MKRLAPVVLTALLLSGCGSSPPSRFYTLDPVPPSQPMAAAPGPAIEVADVTLPESLDRLSFVTRIGPNRINVSDQDRWAAPLNGMVQRTLAADLARRLPGRTVRMPGDPPLKGHSLKIVMNVRQFIGDQAEHVVLDADWAVMSGGRTVLPGRPESISVQAASPGAGVVTAAMSQALAMLSDRIAIAIAHDTRA